MRVAPVTVVVAAATPPGASALALIRLSGEGLDSVLARFVRSGAEVGGAPRRCEVFDAQGTIDDGLIWLGKAPRTYTGEPTAELSLHGNPRIVERTLEAAVAAGARLAEPGEFTRRALLHGKLDLVQAEAVLQVAEARSDRGLALAREALDGSLSQAFAALREPLLDVAAELEARLDLGHDELVMLDDDAVDAALALAETEAREAAEGHRASRAWVHGARVALVGPVNAGKSSLFNQLVGRPRALVHASAGTTRDVLELAIDLDGLQVTLLDTAGERQTDDPIEAAGLALAAELVDEADLVVLVAPVESTDDPVVHAIEARLDADLRVANGVDRAPAPTGWLATSAHTGEGIGALRQAIREALVGREARATRLQVASRRQAAALHGAADLLAEAREALPLAGPAAAADALTEALEALDGLTGADTREDVLSRLFERFCIGK